MNELNILYYPQDNLSKEERKINIFIQKEIFGSDYVVEAHCNIDPESGLTELCYTKERKNYFSKYEETLLLPAYLNHENAMTNDDFFEQIASVTQKGTSNHKNEKEKFFKDTISYNNWHITSFEIVPHYTGNNDLMNQVLNKALKDKIINKESYLLKVKEILNIKDDFDLLILNPLEKGKALYLLINDKEKIEEENVVCFFNKKIKK